MLACRRDHQAPGKWPSPSHRFALAEQAGKERKSDLPDESLSSSPVVELFDSLEPIGPRVGKKAWDGRVLALLQRPDFEVAHAFATGHQQPLWVRHNTADEEAEIQMFFKNRDVQNPFKAGILRPLS